MISLSKRLDVISKLINSEDVVIDVGCDHALLDIYLSNKYKKRYYASDIKASALKNAKKNIEKYNAYDVVLLNGNGLEKISDDVNAVVISGMGFITMKFILKDIKKYKNINKVILQSNTNHEDIRKYMLRNGFYIDEEHIVLDNNIYYIISSFKRGKRSYSRVDKELGISTDKDLKKYLEFEIKKSKAVIKVIPKKYFLKRYKVSKRLQMLNNKLNKLKD